MNHGSYHEGHEVHAETKNLADVLVTGATGFAGKHLVRHLVDHGMRVRATARESSLRDGLQDLPIDWRVGKLHDEQFVRDAVQGVEYIFHLASNYRQAHESDQDYRDIHVVSTQHLARAASD